MAKSVYEFEGLKLTASIAASGSATGQWIKVGDLESAISLILEGAGSTDVTVTYEISYTKIDKKGVPKFQYKDDATLTPLQNIAPNDAGAVSAQLTNADIAAASGNRLHGTVTPVTTNWIRFIVTNNDGVNALTDCRLIGLVQK